ncbi:hypothetical protein RvY_02071 [Ramazzottius varieornatus]|uniref:Uncharacterized protein n=1 Tax=Ramazzottius varieornatus TaxID=947166 RepID=A0A1D1UTL9_RAMVA|nr:hypothetical protein RvY_02071 [Ramazzottius varieornatus]
MASAAIKIVPFFCLLLLISVELSQGGLFEPRHCTWHGTAPMCWPSCPMGKFSIVEDKCGKNKVVCCLSGNKKLCCPNSLKGKIDAATAMAIAKD